MIYDFDKPVNRFGTNCYKHDEMPNQDTIALWVADMDFETAPVVQQAVKARMEHGCFGYTLVPDTYYDASIRWFARRHGWQTQREWYIYTGGVVPAVSAIIKAVKNYQPGATAQDLVGEPNTSHVKVLVQTPAYNCFFSSILNNNCLLEENRLVYNNGYYTIDWDDFERKCSDNDVKIFLLCNPHNPSGRVWTVDELRRMGAICKKHNVFVISDEIHCEFVNPIAPQVSAAPQAPTEGGCNRMNSTGNEASSQNILLPSLVEGYGGGSAYTPFASVSDAPCAVCVSPSKAFNIAGLQIANIIVHDEAIRNRIDKAININECCDVNPFGVIALQAAYTLEGEEWLTQLNDYIYGNYACACEYIKENMPELTVTPLEGTYLMWVNVSAWGRPSDELAQYLLDEANVCVNAGMMYGDVTGRDFIRINLATQRARLMEGLRRIKEKKPLLTSPKGRN